MDAAAVFVSATCTKISDEKSRHSLTATVCSSVIRPLKKKKFNYFFFFFALQKNSHSVYRRLQQFNEVRGGINEGVKHFTLPLTSQTAIYLLPH